MFNNQPQPQKEEEKKVEPVLPETEEGKPDLTQPLTDTELDDLFGTDVKDTPEPDAKPEPEKNPDEVTLGKRRTWGLPNWVKWIFSWFQ